MVVVVFVQNTKNSTFFPEENFSWMDACVAREESHRVWSSPDETCHHFMFREAIFAPVDAVHLMNVGTPILL